MEALSRLTSIAIIAVTIVAMVGCATGETVFNSTAYSVHWVAIHRLLVVANIKGLTFSPSMYRGFRMGMMRKLAACGVRSTILHVGPLDLDERIENAATEFVPDATLAINAIGGELASRTGEQKTYFELAIFGARSGSVLWRARAMYDLTNGSVWDDEVRNGERLATGMISQLRDDAVLKGCPARGEAWPDVVLDCHEERKQILIDAAQIRDPYERARMIRSAPVCNN